jgi:hypothetical protein
MDVSSNKQIVVTLTDGHNYNLFIGFYPLVSVEMIAQPFAPHFKFLTDYNQGMSRGVKCTTLVLFNKTIHYNYTMQMDKCVCIYQSVYAHRTRSGVLIQEIRVSNPSVCIQLYNL